MRNVHPITHKEDFASQKIARFAGFLFLFNLLVPTLGYVFVQAKLYVIENPLETSKLILSHERLFRFGLLSEFILAIGLIILAYCLYFLLRKVDVFLSRIALSLKITEATLMAAVSLLSFLALQLLTGPRESFIESQSVAGLLFLQHGTLNSIPMIFLGIEMVIFNYLFFMSGMIPKWISAAGMMAFTCILIYAVCSIVEPKWAFILFTLPSFIYELIIGSWLIIRGVSFKDPQLH